MLVVIVNYRAAQCVIDCLASLAPEVAEHPGTQVIIIDNASGDESAATMETAIERHHWTAWATVRRAPTNGGFASGNNLAIRAYMGAPVDNAAADDRPELFWLLNPDTVVRPGAIAAIRAFFQSHPSAGVIGTAIEDERGDRWPYAFRFRTLLGEVESAMRASIVSRLLGRYSIMHRMGDHPARVDWVSGASMIFRRDVFETVGLLDENYFLYFEETDFFRRVARARWERWYVPDAVVMHISGQSTGLTSADAALRRVPAYWFASRRRYLVRNHGRLYAAAADVIAVIGLCLWRARCVLRGEPHGDPPYYLRDFIVRSTLLCQDLHTPPQTPPQTAAPARGRSIWRKCAKAIAIYSVL